jgi:hypothetical protein
MTIYNTGRPNEVKGTVMIMHYDFGTWSRDYHKDKAHFLKCVERIKRRKAKEKK